MKYERRGERRKEIKEKQGREKIQDDTEIRGDEMRQEKKISRREKLDEEMREVKRQ